MNCQKFPAENCPRKEVRSSPRTKSNEQDVFSNVSSGKLSEGGSQRLPTDKKDDRKDIMLESVWETAIIHVGIYAHIGSLTSLLQAVLCGEMFCFAQWDVQFCMMWRSNRYNTYEKQK